MVDTSHDIKLISENPQQENSNLIHQGREWVLSIMTRVNEITRIADTSEMVQTMLDLMMEVTQAESEHFFQLDLTTDEFVITHVRGDEASQYLIGLRLKRQQEFSGFVFGNQNIAVVNDLPSEPEWLSAIHPVNASPKRNVIHLPVNNKERMLGVIQIYNFQKAELDLLKVLGDCLAIELDHRNEVNSTRKSNKRLLTLVDVIGEVAGTLDRNHLLHLVTENASHLVDAERSSIFLVDPNTREVIFQVAYQVQDPKSSLELMNNFDQVSFLQKLDESTRSHASTKTFPGHFQDEEFSYFNRSAITVPIRSKPVSKDAAGASNHIIGGLMVLNKQNSSFQEEDAQMMYILANQASTFLQVAEMYESSGELFLGVIKALATAIDAKDPYTQGHSQRVSEFSVLIGQELGLDDTSMNDLRIASLFHDVGKIGIPDTILLKNGKLTSSEMEFVKLHPRTGANILSQVKLLEPLTPAILEHHERLDGSGYPANLTDKQISWMGRIVAVADVYDAMTSDRPYRLAVSKREVLSYLHENAGKQFDAECVRALESSLTRQNLR